MNNTEYLRMATLEKTYWWHRGKLSLVKTLLEMYFPNRRDLKILEVGCGTGEVCAMLQDYGEVTGMDVSPLALDFCRDRGITNTLEADLTTFDVVSHGKKYDLVLALDVLEHIQEDTVAMQKVWELLKEDGHFFVNVPAHKFLWSSHDEALHHKRRYHSVEITTKLMDNGFKIAQKTYFVVFIFPIVAVLRLFNNIFGRAPYAKSTYIILPDFLNNFMVKVLELECFLVKKRFLPFVGTTIAVVAPKDANFKQAA